MYLTTKIFSYTSHPGPEQQISQVLSHVEIVPSNLLFCIFNLELKKELEGGCLSDNGQEKNRLNERMGIQRE